MLYLKPMNEEEYQRFLDYAIPNYAEEKIRAGNFSVRDGFMLSRQEYELLLPAGPDTPDNYLLMIEDDITGQQVGFVWLAIQHTGLQRYATIVNILIYEAFRRQGYATRTFQALEEKIRAMGIYKMTLHVFGHNTGARQLYQQLGFNETNVLMAKDLYRDKVGLCSGQSIDQHAVKTHA